MALKIVPITYREAADYVNRFHRHHKASQGCKFCIGVQDGAGNLCGVAMCGRPVSRRLDDGFTLEINRVCTDGSRNACSALYGACVRIAKQMGYHKVITYILESENGASVKAANFTYDGLAGGRYWTGERNRGQAIPAEKKQRYCYEIRQNDGNVNG